MSDWQLNRQDLDRYITRADDQDDAEFSVDWDINAAEFTIENTNGRVVISYDDLPALIAQLQYVNKTLNRTSDDDEPEPPEDPYYDDDGFDPYAGQYLDDDPIDVYEYEGFDE